ncbi:MAG: hypothetical protein IJ120_13395 [Solobacterium sp.]|nr:hypothetical protein [Solobacterium sp.]
MNREDRLEAFENMLADIAGKEKEAVDIMKQLKAEGKEKTATYRQMMARHLQYQQILRIYREYGLIQK